MATTLIAGTASAAGFLLNDHGAKATGRADAVTATVTDGSAIFYNPAGVGFTEGINIYLGANLIKPSAEYVDDLDKSFSTDTGLAYTPNMYATAKITDMFQVGLGFNTPFGLRISWPDGSPGLGVVKEQSLRTFFISPVVGLNFSKWVPGLTLGGGPDLVPATVKLERNVMFGTDTGSAVLGGSAFGIGGRVGLMYHSEAIKGLAVGVAWRSEVTLDFEGDGDFDIAAPYRSQLPPDGKISTSLTLPQSVLAGVAYKVIPDLEIEFDINWIGWSSYDELVIDFADDTNSVAVKNWRDTLVYRAGLEYTLRDMGLSIRAGWAFDPTPVRRTNLDFTLPDINRQVVSFGASYDLPANSYVDLGVLYVLPGERNTSKKRHRPLFKGTYKINALVVGLSYGIRFGGEETTMAAAPVVESAPTDTAEETEAVEEVVPAG